MFSDIRFSDALLSIVVLGVCVKVIKIDGTLIIKDLLEKAKT